MTRLFLYSLTLVLLVQAPNPDYVGPDDPAHQGQPMTCSNSEHRKAVKQDCPCHQSCDPKAAMEDSKCYVYCRKPACRCNHGCETQ